MKKTQNRKKIFPSALVGAVAVFAVCFSANVVSVGSASDAGAAANGSVQSKIDDLRRQIENYQQEIDTRSEKQESINDSIGILSNDIKKIELQIQETDLQIEELDGEIAAKEVQIGEMEKKVDAQKRMLADFLQELYERGGGELSEIIFSQQSFSEYFEKAESLESFENQIKETHDQLEMARDELDGERKVLVEKKEDKENMRWIQNDQSQSLEREKEMEKLLLSKIGNEKLALEQNVERLRTELSALQSLGEPINLEAAVKAAKYASGLTKVAPEFLLGVLRVESGLGTNVGGGRYKTDMNPSQWDTFRSICKEVGLDPDKTPVSRRACYNKNSGDGCGGWGGAMGPAQFMPTTWMGYKDRIEKTTGKNTANPWNLEDSLVAMGLKLGAVEGVKEGDRKGWAKAAGMYLAGANWDKYSWYSDRVLHYADGFKKVLNDY